MSVVDNEKFMKEIIDNMETLVRVVDDNHNTIYMNKKMEEVFGKLIDCPCMSIMERTVPCENCVTCVALKSGKSEEKHEVLNDRLYKIIGSAVNIDDEEDKYYIEIFQDITEQNEVERKLLEHYDRLKESVEYAKRIQRGMLPTNGIYWDGIELKTCYKPSEELGGDIFDIIKLTEDCCLFYIADVAGHGIKASLMTIFIRQTMRTFEGYDHSMEEIIRYIEKQLQDTNPEKEEYITILIGKYNKKRKEVKLVNGGHNCPALLVKRDGTIEEKFLSGLPIATLFSNIKHDVLSVNIDKDDKMLLYTDGVVEINNEEGKQFGIEGIKEAINEGGDCSNRDLAMDIYKAGRNYTKKKIEDDITILEFTFRTSQDKLVNT